MSISLQIWCVFLVYFVQNICCKVSHSADSNILENKDELIFAHTLCRHGDRNIYQSFPTDPYKSAKKYWPEGYGQLTNLGKIQHYKLGKYFRKRYHSLLGDGSYSADKVYVLSTDKDRVLMSAEANLASLFQPFGDQIWNKNLEWQPTPVHTVPLSQDYILASEKRCDHFDYVMLQYMNTTAYTSYFTNYAPLIKYAEEHSGLRLSTLTDITNLYDTLFIERLKGKCLPKWTEQIMTPGGDFEFIAISWYGLFTQTTEMKRLRSGFLLKEIFDRFTNKTLSTLSPDRNLWLYFAHDITISNMLNSLGLYKLHQPPYASCLFFELYKSSNGIPYVQIFYRMSSKMKNIPALHIPGCGTKCPLASLYQLYKDILPTQSFDEECALRNGERLPVGGNPENNSL